MASDKLNTTKHLMEPTFVVLSNGEVFDSVVDVHVSDEGHISLVVLGLRCAIGFRPDAVDRIAEASKKARGL